MEPIHVVKLGGSLLNLQDISCKLATWMQPFNTHWLMVVGGGQAANIVRQWDQVHHLSDEVGHWLAIQAMQFNTQLILQILDSAVLVHSPKQANEAWHANKIAVVDPYHWLKKEQQENIHIPHHWQFTSDSIAAHLATQLNANQLTLLKSTLPAADSDIKTVVEMGIVDEAFEQAAKKLAVIELVNLRAKTPTTYTLKAASQLR